MSFFGRISERFLNYCHRHGWRGVLAVAFYPVIALLTTPIRLAQTLWNCRVLALGQWQEYNRFNPYAGLNSLSYWTEALNLARYGRNGRSPIVGLGDCFLGDWWYISLPSHYAYWRFGAAAPLMAMFGWWTAHFLWLDQPGKDGGVVILLMFLTLVSITFYANTFVMQNYNAWGWLFAPVGLYGWWTGNWALATLAWLGASFGSFTVVFLAAILSVAASGQAHSFMPVLTIIPACLKISTHFWPLLQRGSWSHSILRVMKLVGMLESKAKYKYELTFNIMNLYYLVLSLQFFLVFWYITGTLPLLLAVGILIFLMNNRLCRFADYQSMQMLLLSISSAMMLSQGSLNLPLLISYWLFVSPIPVLAGFLGKPCLAVAPVYEPFLVSPIITDLEEFLDPVTPGSRVLMCFDDPEDKLIKIFDGYRVLLEGLLYAAARRGIHLMPDWHGVFALNYAGAPDFWGREVHQARQQMQNWQADYLVIYQPAGSELDPAWQTAGFQDLTQFSWTKYDDLFGPVKPYTGPTPDWWLLKRAEGCAE